MIIYFISSLTLTISIWLMEGESAVDSGPRKAETQLHCGLAQDVPLSG